MILTLVYNSDMSSLGHHVVLDLYECGSEKISDFAFMKNLMHQATVLAGCNVVSECFHEFNPAGTSGCIIISESNFCLHTWHEYNYVAIDLFYCGDVNIEAAVKYLIESVQSNKVQRTDLSRGILKIIKSPPDFDK